MTSEIDYDVKTHGLSAPLKLDMWTGKVWLQCPRTSHFMAGGLNTTQLNQAGLVVPK